MEKESDVDKLGLKKSEELSLHEKCQSNKTKIVPFGDSCKLFAQPSGGNEGLPP